MSKERSIKILEYRINELDIKLLIYQVQKISSKKIETLEKKKMKYENQLENILAA